MSHNPLRSKPRVIIPDRPQLSKAAKVRIWNRENGLCKWCGKPVALEGSGVEYDHWKPRELSGDDSEPNLYALHAEPCHREKTLGEDRPRITKAHHQEKLTRPKERKPGGFRGWRNMRGEIVWRGER